MSEQSQDDRPRHLRRYTETYLGPKGRLHPSDRIGLWAIVAQAVFLLVAAVVVLGR